MQMIGPSEPVTRIYFQTDPEGTQGLTGTYHRLCARRFQSLARAVNMSPWGRF
jgi:hypothetical protein